MKEKAGRKDMFGNWLILPVMRRSKADYLSLPLIRLISLNLHK